MRIKHYGNYEPTDTAVSLGLEIHYAPRPYRWAPFNGYKRELHITVHFWKRMDEFYIRFGKIDKRP